MIFAEFFIKFLLPALRKKMLNSLLVRALQQLPPKGLGALADFDRCPLFNRRPEVTRLCEHPVARTGKLHATGFDKASYGFKYKCFCSKQDYNQLTLKINHLYR
jgi:hypothetical protein